MKRYLLLILIAVVVTCKKKTERGIEPENHPPTITSAHILPSAPSANDELTVRYSAFDRDRDKVEVRIEWYLNGNLTEFTTEKVKFSALKKGDLISCRLIPSDGKSEGEIYEVEPVRVINSPPVVKNIGLSPVNPKTNEEIKATVEIDDPDGDPVEIEYRWYVNNRLLPEVTFDVLSPEHTKKGDIVVVSVTPFDGETKGREFLSSPVVVQNSPPLIVSNPPSTISEDRFVYKVEARDPDGDRVIFKLSSAPPEARMTEDGLLIIENPPQNREIYIKIEASDESGATSYQEFRFILSK